MELYQFDFISLFSQVHVIHCHVIIMVYAQCMGTHSRVNAVVTTKEARVKVGES